MSTGLTFLHGYYHRAPEREALNALVRAVFGLDFSPWNALGFGSGEYTPFSFFEGERAVANVSASPMHLVIDGSEVEAVQIGTVATLPEYRNRGLARDLMDRVQAHWDNRCELIFLFANKTVLDFYQQFGYRSLNEHRFSVAAPEYAASAEPARLFDIGNQNDRDLMFRLAERRVPVSARLGIHRHTWLLLFHALAASPGGLRYIEELEVVVLFERVDATLRIIDVVGERVPTLAQLYPYIGQPGVDKVELCFAPDLLDVDSPKSALLPDSHLFVRGSFPIEGEVFRFPETSQA